MTAVRAVLNGKVYFPSRASAALLQGRSGQGRAQRPQLTLRERELLQLVAEGKSNKRVASILGISKRTVENHRANIMRKLGLQSFSELVRYAVRNNIVAA